jgi:probable F420-dependent oxidoreductase
MSHGLRFGVVTSGAPDGKAWRDRARRAEELGYSTRFMPDHFQDQWSPTVGLSLAAEATSRLRVGTLVYDNDYRHPAVLAKEMATLDLATGGRVELGLGAGWKRSDYDESGIPFDGAGTRISRMIEGLAVMRALWTSADPVEFAGEHYHVSGAVGTPRPHRATGPLVCIGGGGRRILSFAAREADIVAVNATLSTGALGVEAAATSTPDAFDEKVEWVRAAAGPRINDIELQCHCAFTMVTHDAGSVLDSMAGAFGVRREHAGDIPLLLVGTVDELCAAILTRRERWGFTYWVIPDGAMEAFAPVVERLSSYVDPGSSRR